MKDLIEQAKELMQWADEYGIDEISLSNGEDRIHIARNTEVVSVSEPRVTVSDSAASQESPKKTKLNQSVSKPEAEKKTIVSPMVGTFYRTPSPEAKPFVSIGDRVKSGDTVCIVEAMKVMNQIKAPMDGVVKKILASNAELVYKGQVLFEIADS
tara:strand:+ start:768 stop:1232 length:465 start_codon:yes stop_codon:yes gene_type:complete